MTGSSLPLDEKRTGLRCTPRTRAGLSDLREELLMSVTSEVQGMDARNSKRRLGFDIVGDERSPRKIQVWEGLRLLHSPPEGSRRKKESVSRIASTDVPSALGSDLGNKRRRRAPSVYKESGGGHVEQEIKPPQPSNGQVEENERRSERLKERRKLERRKSLEESQAIHWEVQFGTARGKKKCSDRRLQQKGKGGKSKEQARKQAKVSWSLDREKGMSAIQVGHDEQGGDPTWTSRLRERGKKRVLEFCSEVQVEAFAPDARIVKQKVEKVDETLESSPDRSSPVQTAEELDELFLRSWSRKHPRNSRTRARFQSFSRERLHGGVTGQRGAVEVDHIPSSFEEKQLKLPLAEATTMRYIGKETEPFFEDGCHASPKEHVSPSVQESASKSIHERLRASSVQNSSAVEGWTEHTTQPVVPSIPSENKPFEALEGESEKQIEIVLDLGIKPSREENAEDNTEQIAINAACSSGYTVSYPPQTQTSASCELAEAGSASAAGSETVCISSSLTSADKVLEKREHLTGDGIVRVKMLEVELSTSYEKIEEKLVDLEDHVNRNDVAEEMAVESGEHRACSKFTKEVVELVQVVDTETCKEKTEGWVEVREATACSEDPYGKVVEGCEDRADRVFFQETAVKVRESRGCFEPIEGIVLGVQEDKVSSEVPKETVVQVQEHVSSEITRERTVEVSDFRVCRAIANKKVLVVQEHVLCLEVENEEVVEGRENTFDNELDKEKVPEGKQNFCDETASMKAFENDDPTVGYKIVEEQVLQVTQHRTRGDISEEEVAEANKTYSVREEIMEVKISGGGEHVVCTDAVQYAEVKVLEGLDQSKNVLLERGDESASGNSEGDISGSSAKEVPRGAEDSAANSVDDFDVLAKYCRTKSRKNGSRRIFEKPEKVEVIPEGSNSADENLERAEISGEDAVPCTLKASSSTGGSEPAEENGSEDHEETAGTRLQSLLDVVRIEVDATPELGESPDFREMSVAVSLAVSHTVKRTEEPNSKNAFTKERAAKYSNDFKRGFVSLGLKCALCGGSSDGKWACELRSSRKTRARDGPNHGSPKISKLDVKEWGKLQVKKGWLGRLLGPLSERVGVAGAWVHEECAVWSPEVYFAGVGRLKNVKAAIRRGRLLKCSHCGQPGATIGCRVDRCPQNYHLPCAHFDGCSFDHKKYLVACSEHLHLFPSRCRRFLEYGNDVQTGGSGDMKDSSKLHRGNFRRMMIERRAAASSARLKDLEAEEKCMEKSGEDEEFVRRERKRLQRDLAKIVPTKLGGRNSDGEQSTIPEGWNSVAGLQDVVECLKEMVILPLLYPGVFDRLGIVPPRGVLLHGHSGTGKTLVVRALAGACARGSRKISYFARKGADCLGKYVGDAERQLRLLFQVAEQHQPSIIFFDEIDGLAPSRSRDGQDQTHSSVVSTLLALMDGLSSRGSVIVIGATNRPDALDPALRRPGRFDREIYFPLPSVADRAAILGLHTRSWVPRPSAELLSTVARATRGFAGADLRALCVEVALKALKRVAPIHRLMDFAERRQTGDSLPPLPKIEVKAFDWASALNEAPPPCSMRMANAALSFIPGSPLPWYLVPSLVPALVEVLLQLHSDARCSMPPVLFKAVSFIALELQSVARRSDLSDPKSQYKWMDLFQSGGHNLILSVEAALTATGLLGNVEELSDCGRVQPPSGEAAASKPFVLDTHSSDVSPKYQMDGSSRSGHFRVLISGKGKRGQRLVAASIIAGFEGFCGTRALNLPTMLHEGDGDVIQGLNRILGAGKVSTPCMLFMPQIESWCMVREDVGEESPGEFKTSCTNDVRKFEDEAVSEVSLKNYMVDGGNSLPAASSTWNIFLQHMKSLSPNTSIILLATSHLLRDELPSKVVDFFMSGATKCREEHGISRNQPVPCALVELPPLREHVAVVERASQDISRSLAGRLVRFLNHNEESANESCASAISRLAGPSLPSDETPKVGSRDGSSDDGNECLVDAECSKPMEQLSLASDMPEHPILSSCLPDLTLKLESCGRNSLDDCPLPLFRPRTLPGSWSSEQRALQFAIAQLSHQILSQAHFSDLRRISTRSKAGPCLSTSLIDQRILGTANHYRSISFSGDNNPFEDRFDRRDEKNTHASQVYGLAAIGLKGKSGFYSSGTEFACEIATVLKLLRERVKSKVESGRDFSVYVPLLSKISGLEDIVSSWLYQTRRLEAAAKVLGGVQSVAPALRGEVDTTQPEQGEAHEASLSFPPESSDHKTTFCNIPEKVGETDPKKSVFAEQNAIDMETHGNNVDPVTHSQMMDAGEAVLEGCDTAPVSSDRLAAEETSTDECSQRDSLVNFDAEVLLQASIANHLKSQDIPNVPDSAAESSEHGVCGLPCQKNHPKKIRVYIKSESLHPLSCSIRKMILVMLKGQSAGSVETLYEVIASCAASIRVVSDKLIREVEWTSGCHGEVPCPVGSEQRTEVVDGLRREVCLCPLTEAVRILTNQPNEEAVDL